MSNDMTVTFGEGREFTIAPPPGYRFEMRGGVCAAVPIPEPPAPTYERWEPELNERYWFFDLDGRALNDGYTTYVDRERRDFGNTFPTKAAAERTARWIRANLRLRELARMMNPADGEPSGWVIYRNTFTRELSIRENYLHLPNAGATYFRSEEDAMRALDILIGEGLSDDLFLAP